VKTDLIRHVINTLKSPLITTNYGTIIRLTSSDRLPYRLLSTTGWVTVCVGQLRLSSVID